MNDAVPYSARLAVVIGGHLAIARLSRLRL